MEGHAFGKSVNILKFNDVNEISIDKPELDQIFHHPDVKDRKMVVVSIVEAFRKGKSFFLDYCLRYMYANVSKLKNK